MSIGDQMKSRIRAFGRATLRFLASTFLALLVLVVLCQGQEAVKTAAPAQKTFATPKDAADALLKACDGYDVTALTEILGPQGEDLVSSEDPVRDKSVTLAFAAKAREKNSVSIDPNNPNRAVMMVGNDNWPMPI